MRWLVIPLVLVVVLGGLIYAGHVGEVNREDTLSWTAMQNTAGIKLALPDHSNQFDLVFDSMISAEFSLRKQNKFAKFIFGTPEKLIYTIEQGVNETQEMLADTLSLSHQLDGEQGERVRTEIRGTQNLLNDIWDFAQAEKQNRGIFNLLRF